MIRRANYEAQEQIAVAQYIRYRYPKVLFTASTAGVKLPLLVALQLKRMGARRGAPDLMIFSPRGMSHGLFIEMKRSPKFGASQSSPEQIEWRRLLIERGYEAYECKGFDEAKTVIDTYLAD